MSKSSLKPKATLIWSKQTEKLRKRFDLYFEKEKMDEMFARLERRIGKTNHELLEIISK